MLPVPLTIPAILVAIGLAVLALSIWRIYSARLQPATWRRRTAYVFFSLTTVIGLLFVFGTTWNVIAHDRFVAGHPAPGKLYDVNGYKMHLWCTGEGSPTLIAEAGLGGSTAGWEKIQPGLSQTTRVCSYDRAGEGWSELQPGPRDSDHIVDQLHALLQTANITGPFVMMGHSGGGFFIREYATKYSQDVVGLIFVDAGTPRIQLRGSKQLQAEEFQAPWYKIVGLEVLLDVGATRMAGACSKIEPTHNWGAGAVQGEMECFPQFDAPIKELKAVAPDGEETYKTGPYTFPIMIISQSWSDPLIMPKYSTPALNKEAIKVWNDLQEEMKGLSPDNRRIIASGTGHLVMIQRPDIFLKEIPPFIERIRQHGPPTDMNGTTITE